MDRTRLGLISTTTQLTHASLLPYEAIEMAFRDVDAILHTGGLPSTELSDHLSGIAPTRTLTEDVTPSKHILTFGEVRVGLIDGYPMPRREKSFWFSHRFGDLHPTGRQLLDHLLLGFSEDDVDVIVFGESNAPMRIQRQAVILINPGVVYPISEETAQWQLLTEQDNQRRALLESHIRATHDTAEHLYPRSTVGILDIYRDGSTQTTIRDLPLLTFA